MSVPWTRFVQQVPDIGPVIDFYINHLGTGPVDSGFPIPWVDAWVFMNASNQFDLPRSGPQGQIPPEDLAAMQGAVYAGIGGCCELEFERVSDARVQGYPIVVGIEAEGSRSRDVGELFELHRSRGVKILSGLRTMAWGHRGYTVEDINGYHLTIRQQEPHLAACDAVVVVPDLEEAVRHYEQVLGLTDTLYCPGDATQALFPAPGILLRQDAELATRTSRHMFSVYVENEDVEPTYHAMQRSGGTIVDELADKPWGLRQFIVADHIGNQLRFAGAG